MKWKQDDAVSNIIGAVIFTALIISTMVIVRVDYVPLLEEDREAQAMRKLTDEMTMLKSDIDRQVDNRLNLPMSNGVTVGRQGSTGFLRPVRVPGDVNFEMYPGTSPFKFDSAELLMTSGTRAAVNGVNEQWQTLISGTELTNISQIQHLRLRVTDPEGQTSGDNAVLLITDANGLYAGKVVVTYVPVTSDYAIEIAVYSANSAVEPINIRTDTFKSNYQPAYYYRNMLEDQLLFDQVLEAAEKPFKLTLSDNGLPSSFAASYTKIENGIEVNIGGGGLLVPNFERTATAGRLEVNAPNQYFPAQRYIYEYGGVILSQDDAQVMIVPPQFVVTATTSQTQMEIIVPTITGVNTTSAGVPQYVVRSNPMGQSLKFQGTMAEMNWTLKTNYPDAWMGFFNDTLGAAGLSSASGHYSVQKTADGVLLNIVGTQSGTTKDLYVNFAQARIGVTLRAAS